MLDREYQIVSESASAWVGGTAISVGAVLAHLLNKKIRTQKIMARYSAPEALKAKLMTSDDPRVQGVAQTLRPDMSEIEYKEWIDKYCNPSLGIGKAICLFLFGNITLPWQLGKAAVHAGESGETLVDRAIRNGYWDKD